MDRGDRTEAKEPAPTGRNVDKDRAKARQRFLIRTILADAAVTEQIRRALAERAAGAGRLGGQLSQFVEDDDGAVPLPWLDSLAA